MGLKEIFSSTKKIEQRMTEKVTKQIQATAAHNLQKIQGNAEGGSYEALLESFLTGRPVSGQSNLNMYTSYSSQVQATYRKYNGEEALGNTSVRTIVDLRSAMISGEGISVQTKNEELAKWIDQFLTLNKVNGSKFINMVKTGEMEGKELLFLKVRNKDLRTGKPDFIKLHRHPSKVCGGSDFEVNLMDPNDPDEVKDIRIMGSDGEKKQFSETHVKFVKLGGSPAKVNETTTRVGIVLGHCENYDKGLNTMRTNNHLFSRTTPFFETESERDASAINKWIKDNNWKIGQAFAGKAKFSLHTPDTGAMDGVKAELATLAKTISATTGIPVHWLGWVDLMSNRATAEELYDLVSNATSMERTIWAEAFYDIILMAQKMAIDSGQIKGAIDPLFEVKIPVISFTKFQSLVNALSTAYNDGVISKGDYQNLLPGIDPYKTNTYLSAEQDEEVNDFQSSMTDDDEENKNKDQ